MQSTLTMKAKKRFLLGCFGTGILLFLLLYGPLSLDVTYDAWILNNYIETDIIQRYAGWLAYRASETFFPLTFSTFIHYPLGSYASLADGMPFFMVLFKLLSPILPETFQFCGLVVCLNMALQMLCAALLLSLFSSSKWQVYLGSLVFCLSPILIERMFRHTSLSFHWLILLAIYYYIRGRRAFGGNSGGGGIGIALAFLLLGVGSVWLHLYFTPMMLGFFLAYLLGVAGQGIASHRKTFCGQVALFAATIALCVGSGALLGIFDMGVGNTSGYGTMGMNLNALFNPVSLDSEWWVEGKGLQDWSAFLPVRALALNNLESFNYLGLGVLLALLGLGMVVFWRVFRAPKQTIAALWGILRRHLFLALFLAFSTVFAVSNTVCAFSYTLFTIPLPDAILSICSAFRASGRLFWSVNYMLVLAAVLGVFALAKRRPRLGMAALVLLLLVQAVDLSPALLAKHQSIAERVEYVSAAETDSYIAALGDSEVVFYLEITDERALCASLLKEGIANNLFLISRDDYGVAEMQAEIDAVTQALLAGESPYANCTYVTSDLALVESLIALDNGISVVMVGDVYLLRFAA